MSDYYDWSITQDIKTGPFEREIYFKSNDPTFFETCLRITRHKISVNIPGEPEILEENEIISFQKTWKTCLIINNSEDLQDSPQEDILELIHVICKKSENSPYEIFQKNLNFNKIDPEKIPAEQDIYIKSLFQTLLEEIISDKSNPNKPNIEMQINFVILSQEKKRKFFVFSCTTKNNLDENDDIYREILKKVKDFFLFMEPVTEPENKTEKNSLNFSIQNFSINTSILNIIFFDMTYHEKIKLKKIINSFLKNS